MIKNKGKSDLRTLMNLAELKAEQFADGHLTIMRSATEWKAMFGTLNLDTHEGRERIIPLRGHETLEETLEYLVIRPMVENYDTSDK